MVEEVTGRIKCQTKEERNTWKKAIVERLNM